MSKIEDPSFLDNIVESFDSFLDLFIDTENEIKEDTDWIEDLIVMFGED